MNRSIVVALVLLASACASTPGNRGSREAARKPPAGGIAEFRVTSFDGRVLEGRVLIGATVDPLVIDRRLMPWALVELKDIRACDTKDLLKHWVWEPFLKMPQAEDIISLLPGDWHGMDVRISLFNKRTILDDKSNMIEPECFEAELWVRDNNGDVAAKLPIRVVRTDNTSAPKDGGTEAPKPPVADGGAP